MADAKVVAATPAERKSKRVTKPKDQKAKKAAPKKARSARAYPSFFEMISDAIVTLKERNGSSQYAIAKFVEEKHKQLPQNFRKLLSFQLKRLVASGKLNKVKNSFKLPSTAKNATDAKPKVKVAATATKPKTTKVAVAKPKSKVAATKLKPKAATKTKPKPKVAAKPAKTVKDKTKPKAKAKPAPAKIVKKPKSVKSPAKKKAKK